MAKITITLGDHSTETDIESLGKNKEKNIKRIVKELCETTGLDENIGLRTFTYSISFDKKSPGTDDALQTSIESIVTKMRKPMSMVEKVATQEKKAAFRTQESTANPSQKPPVTPPPPPPGPNLETISKESKTDIQNNLPNEDLTPDHAIEKKDSSEILPTTNKQDLNIAQQMQLSLGARRFLISGGREGQPNLEPFSCAVKLVTTKEEITDDSTLYVYFNSKQDLEFSITIDEITTTKLLTDPYIYVESDDPDDWDKEGTVQSKYSQEELTTLGNNNKNYLDDDIAFLLTKALYDQNTSKKTQAINSKVLNSLLTYASRTVGKKLELQTSPQQQPINPSPTVAEPKSQKQGVRNVKSNPDKESHKSIFDQIKGMDKDKKQAAELNQTESTLQTTELQSTSFEEKSDSSITPAEEEKPNPSLQFSTVALLLSNAKKKYTKAMQLISDRVGTPPATPPAPPAPYTKARIQLDYDRHQFLDTAQPTLVLYPLFTIFQKMGINILDDRRLKLDFLEPDASKDIKNDFFKENTFPFSKKSDGKNLPANVVWSSELPLDTEQTAVIIDTPYWSHDAETLDALLNAVVACNIDVNHIYLRADEETIELFSSLKERFAIGHAPLSKPSDPSVYLHNDDDDSEDEFSLNYISLNYTKFTKPSGFFGPYESIDDNFSEETKHAYPSSLEQTELRPLGSGKFLPSTAPKEEEKSRSTESNESEISPTPSTSFSFLLNAMAQNKVTTSVSLALMIGGIGLACAGIVLFPGTVPLALIIAGLASVVAGVALSSRILTTGSLGFHSRGTTERPLINDSEHSAESESQDQYRIYTL